MAFTGKFERVSHENFDEFLTAVDVNEVWKQQAIDSTPIMEVLVSYFYNSTSMTYSRSWSLSVKNVVHL